jgi:succinate dehydrogenase / fumarate reductase, cytochrome b subunit
MATARPRPLSPHLSIWRWRVHTIVSIVHRVTGNAMAFGAVPLFVWWLVAAASGEEAYGTFYSLARGPLGYLVGIGFTWTFFQHMCSGLRHLVMDTGAAFEIQTSKRTSTAAFVFGALLTLALWGTIFLTKGFE